MGKQGVLGPKIRIGPKGYCRPKKRREAKYEFVYELEILNRNQIRIRIYILDVFAVKIRIGPLIFPPIRRIRGGGVQYPRPSMLCSKEEFGKGKRKGMEQQKERRWKRDRRGE
jgi:hypothetical protein